MKKLRYSQFSCSVVSNSLWPHGLQHRASMSISKHEFAQTHVHRIGDAIKTSYPLSSPSPPAFNLSQHQGLFKWVSSSHQWPKYWSFSFSISPFSEYSGLISFRMDWLDLLARQGTLKSLLQHHSSKASILWCSAFFIIQFSHLWLRWWRIRLQRKRPGFNPWVEKIPWRRERLLTPVFWPGEFHGLYSPSGRKESDTTEQLSHPYMTHIHSFD